MMRIYVLEREGYDYTEQTLIYENKEFAVNALLRFALNTNCVAIVYVFESQEDSSKPYKLIESIRLKTGIDPRIYMIWQKQQELGFSTQDALLNLSLFKDTIESITPYISH